MSQNPEFLSIMTLLLSFSGLRQGLSRSRVVKRQHAQNEDTCNKYRKGREVHPHRSSQDFIHPILFFHHLPPSSITMSMSAAAAGNEDLSVVQHLLVVHHYQEQEQPPPPQQQEDDDESWLYLRGSHRHHVVPLKSNPQQQQQNAHNQKHTSSSRSFHLRHFKNHQQNSYDTQHLRTRNLKATLATGKEEDFNHTKWQIIWISVLVVSCTILLYRIVVDYFLVKPEARIEKKQKLSERKAELKQIQAARKEKRKQKKVARKEKKQLKRASKGGTGSNEEGRRRRRRIPGPRPKFLKKRKKGKGRGGGEELPPVGQEQQQQPKSLSTAPSSKDSSQVPEIPSYGGSRPTSTDDSNTRAMIDDMLSRSQRSAATSGSTGTGSHTNRGRAPPERRGVGRLILGAKR